MPMSVQVRLRLTGAQMAERLGIVFGSADTRDKLTSAVMHE